MVSRTGIGRDSKELEIVEKQFRPRFEGTQYIKEELTASQFQKIPVPGCEKQAFTRFK